ncbi:hepcidin-like [Parambassis ranga]|uniref:Hepcidin-like n=1 Tax=Parambassis ranga TaxID=210632 RepID=A0A6P7JXN7_9TELE|nr:hepcidin-like [Parambassis ranga]
MKTFTVAVAAMFIFLCIIQTNSAFPFTQVQEDDNAESSNNLDASREESVETWLMPYDIRQKHYTGPIRCRYCCGCCALGVCGMCCE